MTRFVSQASVYIDNMAAQTGASLFLQECSPPIGRFGTSPPRRCDWTYYKNDTSSVTFSHGILEASEIKENKGGQSIRLEKVQGLERVRLIRNEQADAWMRWIPRISMMDLLWIVEFQ